MSVLLSFLSFLPLPIIFSSCVWLRCSSTPHHGFTHRLRSDPPHVQLDPEGDCHVEARVYFLQPVCLGCDVRILMNSSLQPCIHLKTTLQATQTGPKGNCRTCSKSARTFAAHKSTKLRRPSKPWEAFSGTIENRILCFGVGLRV